MTYSLPPDHPRDLKRMRAGARLACLRAMITQTGPREFWARSEGQRKEKPYRVVLEDGTVTCTCGDYRKRLAQAHAKHLHGTGSGKFGPAPVVEPCKHGEGSLLVYNRGRPRREDVERPEPDTTPRQWGPYRQAHRTRKRLTAMLLHDLVQHTLDEPDARHGPGRRPVPVRDLAYCAVAKALRQESLDKAEESWTLPPFNEHLTRVPHFSTLSKWMVDDPTTRPANYPATLATLRALLQESVRPLVPNVRTVAIDSSGFRTTTFSTWFDDKHLEVPRANVYVMWHAAVDVHTKSVLALRVTSKREGDEGTGLEGTGDKTQAYGLIDDLAELGLVDYDLVGDGAYNARDLLEYAHAKGTRLYAPFRYKAKKRNGPEWSELHTLYSLNPRLWHEKTRMRSAIESVWKTLKEHGAESLYTRKTTSQEAEIHARAIAANLHVHTRLIHEAYRVPDWVVVKPVASDLKPGRVGGKSQAIAGPRSEGE